MLRCDDWGFVSINAPGEQYLYLLGLHKRIIFRRGSWACSWNSTRASTETPCGDTRHFLGVSGPSLFPSLPYPVRSVPDPLCTLHTLYRVLHGPDLTLVSSLECQARSICTDWVVLCHFLPNSHTIWYHHAPPYNLKMWCTSNRNNLT